jgi:hypothetical protein
VNGQSSSAFFAMSAIGALGTQPTWVPPLDPVQNSGSHRPKHRHVLGKERQADGKHPKTEHWQKTSNAAAN